MLCGTSRTALDERQVSTNGGGHLVMRQRAIAGSITRALTQQQIEAESSDARVWRLLHSSPLLREFPRINQALALNPSRLNQHRLVGRDERPRIRCGGEIQFITQQGDGCHIGLRCETPDAK